MDLSDKVENLRGLCGFSFRNTSKKVKGIHQDPCASLLLNIKIMVVTTFRHMLVCAKKINLHAK